jgi:hypothetical protein
LRRLPQVDFFIAPHIFGDDFGDLDESGDEKEDEWDSPEAKQHISRKSTGNPLEIHWKWGIEKGKMFLVGLEHGFYFSIYWE